MCHGSIYLCISREIVLKPFNATKETALRLRHQGIVSNLGMDEF